MGPIDYLRVQTETAELAEIPERGHPKTRRLHGETDTMVNGQQLMSSLRAPSRPTGRVNDVTVDWPVTTGHYSSAPQGLRAVPGSCYRLRIHGPCRRLLSPVRRIDVVSMHLYGAGIRMVRGSFSSAARLPRLSSF